MVPEEAPNTPTSPAAIASNGVVNSPQRRQNLTSPWASVVRGDTDSSPPPEQFSALETPVMDNSGPEVEPESSDVNGDSNAGGHRRPAWNRPSNGIVETVPVMGGAVSWPALSESTRPVPRSWSDSTRPVTDGSVSSSQAPIISQPPQRPANTNSHTHSAPNSTVPTRPRSRNRGGGGANTNTHYGSGPSQNNFSRPAAPMPPPFPVFEPPYGMVPPMQDTHVRGTRPVGGIGGPHPHSGNDHPSQRSNSRRGNYGPRPRGDGQYHNNHGGRRDQDRRDVHIPPPQYVPPPMGYMPPPLPHGAGHFMQPVRMFPGQMGFDIGSPFFYVPTFPPESFRAMPAIVPQPAPMLVPPVNENLMNRIVKQIDYWFSDENLIKDNYLKSHMDDHGWVSVTLIASFPRVQQLTKDINEILEALRFSTLVEIQGDKVRRRDDWHRFLITSGSNNNESGSRTPGAVTESGLATSMRQVSLDDSMGNANGSVEASPGHPDMSTAKLWPEETSGLSRLANGEDTSEEFH